MNKVSRYWGDDGINMELKLWKNLNNSFEETGINEHQEKANEVI